jgi:hypothetical protein
MTLNSKAQRAKKGAYGSNDDVYRCIFLGLEQCVVYHNYRSLENGYCKRYLGYHTVAPLHLKDCKELSDVHQPE